MLSHDVPEASQRGFPRDDLGYTFTYAKLEPPLPNQNCVLQYWCNYAWYCHKMVSRHMFTWLWINIWLLEHITYMYIFCLYANELPPYVRTLISSISLKRSIITSQNYDAFMPMFSWSTIKLSTSPYVSNDCMFVISKNCQISAMLELITCKFPT